MVGDGRPVVCKKTNAASCARLRAGWGKSGFGSREGLGFGLYTGVILV